MFGWCGKKMKIFDKWEIDKIQVSDQGLKKYIGLKPAIIPKTSGRYSSKRHTKWKMNIVERLMTKLSVPGHRGKKHLISSGRTTGKYTTHYKIVKEAFEIIEKRTKKNPIEILVHAIENAARREEIAAYQVGGIIIRRAVVTSPQRRVDLALRVIVQAAYRKSFGRKDSMATSLANELIAAAAGDASKTEEVKENERIEREAEGAR